MSRLETLPGRISEIRALMRQKLGVRAPDLGSAMARAHRRLPRRVYRAGLVLARAEPMIAHPKLRLTLDPVALDQSAEALREHLDAIDLADRRKGFLLGILGGLAFNLLALFAILIVVLVWRGYL